MAESDYTAGAAQPNQSIRHAINKLWDYGQPDLTEQRFAALVPAAEASGDPDHLGQLLTQLARSQGLQRKFDQARSTLDRVEKMLAERESDHRLDVVRVRYALESGRVLNSSDQPDKALPFFEQAAKLAEAAGEIGYQIDAVHMVAIAAPDVNEKINWNRKALTLIQNHPAQSGWLSAVYNNLGEAYISSGKYELALDIFRKIIDMETARGRAPEWFMHKDVARCLRLTGKPLEALAIMQPLADEEDKTGQHNGWISEELAEDLAALGRFDEAQPRFQQAYDVFAADPWEVEHEPQRLAHLKQSALRP
jgi:tetratricopeptide (TPR) repeat protein